MKRLIGLLCIFILLMGIVACGNKSNVKQGENDIVNEKDTKNTTEKQENNGAKEGKISGTNQLVVYFSCTGTTENLAKYAAEILNADLYQIVPEIPYTEEDLAYYTGGRADREQKDPDVRPAISGSVDNLEQYDTIILGYPKL